MNGMVVGINRRDGVASLTVRAPVAQSRRVAVLEKRADNGATVAVAVGDTIRLDGDRVFWTPRSQDGSDIELVLP